jgi:Na+-driven multidrug efflux pump
MTYLFVFVILIAVLARDLLTLAGVDPEVAKHASVYLQILIFAYYIDLNNEINTIFLVNLGYQHVVTVISAAALGGLIIWSWLFID